MSRSKEELLSLFEDLKKWHFDDLGCDYNQEDVLEVLRHLKKMRLSEFLKRRLGHLRDRDFFAFAEIIEGAKVRAKTKKA
jgi:hypothetical protein